MAVVINEFEAIADSALPQGPAPSNGGPGQRLKPSDLHPALLRMAFSRARLRAH